MNDCCKRPDLNGIAQTKQMLCPSCQKKGRAVEFKTLQSLLKPTSLRRCLPDEFHFCQSPDCPVVYFSLSNHFETADLQVAVFQKSTDTDTPVCYCFGFLKGDLTGAAGASIPKIIQAYVKNKQCACEVRNPQGRCCLGNVQHLLQKTNPT